MRVGRASPWGHRVGRVRYTPLGYRPSGAQEAAAVGPDQDLPESQMGWSSRRVQVNETETGRRNRKGNMRVLL